MNLYECDHVEKHLAELVANNDGEVTEEILAELVKANTATEEKRLGFSHYMRNLETAIAAHKEEEKRIAEKRKTMERNLAWAKQYIKPYVVEHGKQTIGTFTWSLRKSETVEIGQWYDNRNLDYNTKKETYSPDKKKLKEMLKAGEEVVGVTIETNQNLQFKQGI